VQTNIPLAALNFSSKTWKAMVRDFRRVRNKSWFDGPAVYCLPLVFEVRVFVLFSGASSDCYVVLEPAVPTDRPPILLVNWALKHFAPLTCKPGFSLALPSEGKAAAAPTVSQALQPHKITPGEASSSEAGSARPPTVSMCVLRCVPLARGSRVRVGQATPQNT
jgi:hypothetical protein